MKLKIPPPVQALIFGFIMWAINHWSSFGQAEFALPMIIAAAGLAIIIVAALNFKAAKTTVNPMKPSQASSLVIVGVFKISRNPMYLGLLIIISAWALYLGNVLSFAVLPVFVLYITNFQIKPEEEALVEIFGDEFEQYCSSVRRWI